MATPTPAELAQQMSDLFDRMSLFINQFRVWVTGTASGGDNSDGYYDLTDPTGFVHSIPSPEKMSILSKQMVVGSVTGVGPYVMDAGYYGKLIRAGNSATISVTLNRSAPVNTTITFVQVGTGSVRFGVQSGGLQIRNRQGFNATAGQWAVATLVCISNSTGNNAEWLLLGDLRVV